MNPVTNFEHIEKVQDDNQERILGLPGVNGFHIGRKTIGGNVTDIVAIVVHVDKKIPADELDSKELIEQSIDGVPTDVVVSGRMTYRVMRKEALPTKAEAASETKVEPSMDAYWYRPIVGGCLIAATDMPLVGTLGGFVKDAEKTYLLSCQHILGQIGHQVYQPVESEGNFIATVSNSANTPEIDCGIAELDSSIDWTNYILDFGPIQGTRILPPNVMISDHYEVQKRGITTGQTFGFIWGYRYTGILENGSSVKNQLLVRPLSINSRFSDAGDSGSFVVNDQYEAIGLLIGGFDDGHDTTAVTPIDRVLSAMNVSIVIDNNPPLYVVHRGSGSENACYQTTLEGEGTWSPDVHLNIGAIWPPTLVTYKNGIFNLRQDAEETWGGGKLMCCRFGSGAWGQDIWLGAGTWLAPGAASYHGKLYCIHHESDKNGDNMFLMTYDGTSWTGDDHLPFGCALAPALVPWRGLLHCFHAGGSDRSIWWTCFNGTTWSPDTQLAPTSDPYNYYKSSFTPTVVSFQNKLYCFHLGEDWYTDNLWCFTFDGSTWSVDADLGAGSTLGPSAIVQDGVLRILHEGHDGSGQLWQITFDGTTWVGDTPVNNVGTSGAPGLAFVPTFRRTPSGN